jgi:hypothetical protein
LGAWLRSGEAAIVNALAYRSPKISDEADNKAIAERLPSVAFHRDWLASHLLPAANQGQVTVVVKRPALWKIKRSPQQHDHILFPQNHVSPHLPKAMVELLAANLRK